ncbi:hypothetical protein ADP71_17960 [Vitreoscilla sp. C1]|uniref:hypothetical protein n=1 Tax=Vitreoscilla sp. (strain C1) TaxID=96942 RepID=UPI000CDBD13E|nr:hypothetical protein [Vitreoscilla sp. C1]AUZ05321.1 hypothetical protein ADP71_17960 [Vitreoscilla sp. C1]
MQEDLTKRLQALKQYGFKDENGHPLENCQEFVELEMILKRAKSDDAPLSPKDKEAVKSALLAISQNNPHMDLESLARTLCSSLKHVNSFNQPAVSGGATKISDSNHL